MPITKPNVLVVEGKEDAFFFEAMARHLGLDIQILPIGGKPSPDKLKAITKTPGFSNVVSLGVARDANANPKSAFQSVCDALKGANLLAPKHPMQPVGDSPKVTVIILPGMNTPGALEDLCLEAVKQDTAMPCVEQYFQCLKQQSPSPNNPSKAKVQAFLASRTEPGKRLGEAAQAGYWPWSDPAFNQVKNCLRNSFAKATERNGV
ncbi:MAG: hypothetical protein HYX88_04300 [Chloroflexi bacterium]|nr:hypothetical protein [Chloroflexota bacterium]